jgi:hypothetical protein
MAEYLIAQRFTTSDAWSLLVGGREVFSDNSLDAVLGFIRSQPEDDLPLIVHVAVQPMADTRERLGPKPARSIFATHSFR